jgi:putative oxidoreductase
LLGGWNKMAENAPLHHRPRAQARILPARRGQVQGRYTMHWKQLLFGSTARSPTADAGLAILRVTAGLAIALAHGMSKVPPSEQFTGYVSSLGIPAPGIAVWLAMLAEFGGGILLAIGLLTRPAALLLVIHFAIVVLVAHAGQGFGDRELPLLFGVIALQFLLTGPGRYSADAAITRT